MPESNKNQDLKVHIVIKLYHSMGKWAKSNIPYLWEVPVEILLTLTMMKREPKFRYVPHICALLLSILAFSGLFSIYQSQASYELTNRFSAYSLLNSEEPSPISYSKTINSLLTIESIDELEYKIPTNGLKIEPCGLIHSFFGVCKETSLYGSTNEKDIIFDSVSSGIAITDAYRASVLHKNVSNSFIGSNSYYSFLDIRNINNGIISTLGSKNVIRVNNSNNSSIILTSENPLKWGDFLRWYYTPSDSRIDNHHFMSLSKTLEISGYSDFKKHVLKNEIIRKTTRESGRQIYDNLVHPFIRNKWFESRRTEEHKKNNFSSLPLLEPRYAKDINWSPLNFTNNSCSNHNRACFSDNDKLLTVNRIELRELKRTDILSYGELTGVIYGISDSNISLQHSRLGFPIWISGIKGNVNFINKSSKGNQKSHVNKKYLTIFKQREYDNKESFDQIRTTLKSGYPHFKSNYFVGFSNLNLKLLKQKAKNKEHIKSDVSFYKSVKNSIIEANVTSLDFKGNVYNSLLILDSNVRVKGKIMSSVIMPFKNDLTCDEIGAMQANKTLFIDSLCEEVPSISAKQFAAFLLSIKESEIKNNEAAFYSKYNEVRSRIKNLNDEEILALSKKFAKDSVTIGGLYDYITSVN
ncbi:hypothetical protein F0237_01185 [Vibrio tubiashii]|uniref:Uncharacterized protein n=1 Tax=Vibrio tubiashii TaxID=29498 RepID=A0AAE5GM70_9VIBR|nr:hypothetical protein [Vibrio tubiashii]NOI79256.1 hypothetical protein [Vibrio tubiashii]